MCIYCDYCVYHYKSTGLVSLYTLDIGLKINIIIIINVDQRCVDVDIMIKQYDKYLSDLLNKHAPKKNIYVVDRPLNEWMTDDILTVKAIRRKNELIWRKTRNTINFDIYYDSCKAVKKAISKSNQN